MSHTNKMKPFSILLSLILGCASPQDGRKTALAKADARAQASDVKATFHIDRLEIDSAGGVNLDLQVRNLSAKTIKYFEVTLAPYNAVGDRVSSEIGNRVHAILSITGPIPPVRANANATQPVEAKDVGSFSGIWYNSTISCVKPTGISITYMDNTKLVITAKSQLNQMNSILADAFANEESLSDFEKSYYASSVCK